MTSKYWVSISDWIHAYVFEKVCLCDVMYANKNYIAMDAFGIHICTLIDNQIPIN